MGVGYSPVLGVGVDQDEITFNTLTEFGKNIIRGIFKDQRRDLDEFGCDCSDSTVSEWFDENIHEHDLYYELGLTEYTGNLFSGWYGERGVPVSVYKLLDGEDVGEQAKVLFASIVNLEPKVFYGVLVS